MFNEEHLRRILAKFSAYYNGWRPHVSLGKDTPDGRPIDRFSEAKAAFLADSQVPWGVGAISGSISEPAWTTKPSWYLVATEYKMIPPPAQRQMAMRAGSTIAEATGSHAISRGQKIKTAGKTRGYPIPA